MEGNARSLNIINSLAASLCVSPFESQNGLGNHSGSAERKTPLAESAEVRVLLVEDNDGDYVLTREMFADIKREEILIDTEFRLGRVNRLSQALKQLSEADFDLVLLDLSLPDAADLEAFHEIKSRAPHLPIVLLTGFTDIKLAKRALAEGAQDCLMKGQVDMALLAKSILYSIERKRAEEDRHAMERRLMVSQRLESLGLMAGGLAHDLGNLLQGILSCTNLAQRPAVPTELVQTKLSQIEKLVEHATDLVGKLFACSATPKFTTAPVDFSDLVQGSVELAKESLKNGVHIKCELEPGLPALDLDAAQMRQVIINLISNAAEATEGKTGTVKVRTGQLKVTAGASDGQSMSNELEKGSYVFVDVIDNGKGMDQRTQQRIFEPFFTTKTFGRGLGLASVLGIVRSFRGAIQVESRAGKGTAFRVLLPC